MRQLVMIVPFLVLLLLLSALLAITFPLVAAQDTPPPLFVNCTPLPPFQPELFTGCQTTTPPSEAIPLPEVTATITLTPLPSSSPFAVFTQIDPRQTAFTLTPQTNDVWWFPTPTAEEFSTPTPAPNVCRASVAVNSLNVRRSPNGALAGALSFGTSVTFAPTSATNAGGYVWVKLSGNVGALTGDLWVARNFLQNISC